MQPSKNRKFYLELIVLALPIALQNLLIFSSAIVDSMMLSSLGDAAVSSAYVGNQVQTLLQVITVGIEGAILVLAAQYHGSSDRESVRKIAGIGIDTGIIFGAVVCLGSLLFPRAISSFFTSDTGIVSSAADYLATLAPSFLFFTLSQTLIAAERSVENTKIGLFSTAISLGVKILFNYILVFGGFGFEPLGLRGAAVATLIARGTETLFLVIYVFFIDKRIRLSPKQLLHIDKRLLLDFTKYGSPVVLSQLVYAANMMFASFVMGSISNEGALAGLSVANSLNNLSYVALNGLSGALGIMTSKAVGEGNTSLVKTYSRRGQLLFLGLGFFSFIALRIACRPYVSLYGISEAARSAAISFISVYSFIAIGTCYQGACLAGLVKSGGDTAFVFKNDLVFLFLVVIPATVAAIYSNASPAIVLAALKCDHILKCLVAFPKVNSYDWMKNLTKRKSGA